LASERLHHLLEDLEANGERVVVGVAHVAEELERGANGLAVVRTHTQVSAPAGRVLLFDHLDGGADGVEEEKHRLGLEPPQAVLVVGGVPAHRLEAMPKDLSEVRAADRRDQSEELVALGFASGGVLRLSFAGPDLLARRELAVVLRVVIEDGQGLGLEVELDADRGENGRAARGGEIEDGLGHAHGIAESGPPGAERNGPSLVGLAGLVGVRSRGDRAGAAAKCRVCGDRSVRIVIPIRPRGGAREEVGCGCRRRSSSTTVVKARRAERRCTSRPARACAR
jgi:hypothetical protein